MTLLDGANALIAQAAGLCDTVRRSQCRGDCCRAEEQSQGRVVAVTLPDLIALATYLYAPSSKRDLKAAVADLVGRQCALSPFTGTYMLTAENGACSFLDTEAQCSVYTVRPMLCRLFFHCPWIGEALHWEHSLDGLVVGRVLDMAQSLGCHWSGQAGILWRQPWRYDEVELSE
ncbi:MAG: YkgJ family cysteine cluster protein [Anaerolineae bacterium]